MAGESPLAATNVMLHSTERRPAHRHHLNPTPTLPRSLPSSAAQEETKGRKLSKKELAKKLRSGTTSKSS